MHWNSCLYMIIAIIISVVIIFLIKKYTQLHATYLIILVILLDLIMIYIYIYLFSLNDASKIYTIIKIASVIVIMILGYLLWDEGISKHKIVGLILGILAIVLMVSDK